MKYNNKNFIVQNFNNVYYYVFQSVPDELNFGTQAYKDTKELSFHVFNLSPVNIYYKMTCIHCNWPVGDLKRDVKIHPTADTIVAGKDKIITVLITPTTPGFYEFFVQYFVRISSDVNTDLIPNQIPKNICKVCCLCVLPSLKVKCCVPSIILNASASRSSFF